jgi:protein-S-isoprenylcysteine O-methyltransferase Ste14
VNKVPYHRLILALVFSVLQGFAIYYAIWVTDRFWLPQVVSIAGWVILPFFVFLMVYSLFIELPSWKTYSRPGTSSSLVTTGTYALTRHPVVIWYILALLALILATRSVVLLIAAPVWVLLDIVYVILEDKIFFVKMFPGYMQYKQQTPMLIPTRKSILACWKTFRGGMRARNKIH